MFVIDGCDPELMNVTKKKKIKTNNCSVRVCVDNIFVLHVSPIEIFMARVYFFGFEYFIVCNTKRKRACVVLDTLKINRVLIKSLKRKKEKR